MVHISTVEDLALLRGSVSPECKLAHADRAVVESAA